MYLPETSSLKLSLDIYSHNLLSFDQKPENESPFTASNLIHENDPDLVKNEEVKYSILVSQVLAKFAWNVILTKSGEFNFARGCVPLLIYCIQKRLQEFSSSHSK